MSYKYESTQYFIIADIHGFFDLTFDALTKAGFQQNNIHHHIILLGDAFDRGTQTVAVYKWLRRLDSEHRLVYVRGNHEDLLEDCVKDYLRGDVGIHHLHNGTVHTIAQFLAEKHIHPDDVIPEVVQQTMQPIIDWINKTTVDKYEVGNRIFVHGWLPQNEFPTKNDWEKARWLNGMEEACKHNHWVPNKTVFCGHYHTSYGNVYFGNEEEEFPRNANEKYLQKLFSIFEAHDPKNKNSRIVAMDGCTAFSGIVNVYSFVHKIK